MTEPAVKNFALTRPGDPRARTSATVAPSRRTGAFSGLRREETVAGYLFLLPNLVGFLIFSLIPIVATFGLTLTNWNLIGERTFVGFENYQ
jgi:multiple sugar transport system permease protein